MSNLFVLIDGTWCNQHDKSVVYTIYEIIKYNGRKEDKALYIPGVGSSDCLFDKVLGGAFALGIKDQICEAYKYLATNYVEGDKIILVGFSRGAYAVRRLVGMIRNVGLTRKKVSNIDYLYSMYTDTSLDYHPDSGFSKAIRDFVPNIDLLCCFDTVGNLGLPGFLKFKPEENLEFHDTKLSGIVKKARHYLALNERRANFKPCLWEADHSKTDSLNLVFPGSHGDVGGCYPLALSSCWSREYCMDEISSVIRFQYNFKRSTPIDFYIHQEPVDTLIGGGEYFRSELINQKNIEVSVRKSFSFR